MIMTTNILYQPKRQIAIIESARGFAALYVLLTHVIELTGVHDALANCIELRYQSFVLQHTDPLDTRWGIFRKKADT